MNWEHGFVLTAGLCGLVFCVVALILYKFPPKKINHLYGYRTAKSMSSQERWDFAQKYSALRMLESGIVLLVLAPRRVKGDLNLTIFDHINGLHLFLNLYR